MTKLSACGKIHLLSYEVRRYRLYLSIEQRYRSCVEALIQKRNVLQQHSHNKFERKIVKRDVSLYQNLLKKIKLKLRSIRKLSYFEAITELHRLGD
jgi:hypothetical protein